jgi:hypothetical protein
MPSSVVSSQTASPSQKVYTGASIGDGGNDMYDDGNYLNSNLGTALPTPII